MKDGKEEKILKVESESEAADVFAHILVALLDSTKKEEVERLDINS